MKAYHPSFVAPPRWAIQPALTAAPGLWSDCTFAAPLFWGQFDVVSGGLLANLGAGGQYVLSTRGRGVKFSGNNGILVPQSAMLSNEITVALFTDGTPTTANAHLFNAGTSEPGSMMIRQDNGGYFQVVARDSSATQYVGAEPDLEPLAPSLQSFEFDPVGQQIFGRINGVSQSFAGLRSGNRYINSGPGVIGNHPTATVPWDAPVYLVLIWLRLLAASEWAQLAHDPFAMFRPAPRPSISTYHGLQSASWHVKTQQSRDAAWNILTSSLVSAAWWRLSITGALGQTSGASAYEIEFRPTIGSSYQPGTGSAFAGSNSSTASNAFDGSTSTGWVSASKAAYPITIGYHYASTISPRQLYIYADTSNSYSINSFDVQYSTDGTNWTTLKSFSNVTYTNNVFTGTIQTAPTTVTQASAWRILTSDNQGGAWNLLTRNEQISTWAVLNQGLRDLVWRVKTNDFQDSAWSVQTSASNPTDWQILNSGSRATAWKILVTGSGQELISWNILTTLPISTRWHVKTSGHSQSAWRLLNSKSQDTAYIVLTRLSQQIAWTLYAQGRIDTAWKIHVLNSASVAMAWRILNETNLDTSWTVGGIWQSVSATATDWTKELDTLTNWTQVH